MSLPDDNPYAAPQSPAAPVVAADGDRLRALLRVRSAVAMLAVPGVLNYICLHFVYAPHRFRGGYLFDSPLELTVFGALNLLGMMAGILGGWFFGLTAFECAGVVTHHLFGQNIDKPQWLTVMYRALWPLPWAAAIGSGLWLVWLFLYFFESRYPVPLMNVVLGGAGHIAAACVYGNVAWQWYRLRKQEADAHLKSEI